MQRKLRNDRYRRICEEEERDEDRDGVPDVYEWADPEFHLCMAAIHEAKAAEHRSSRKWRAPWAAARMSRA
ncbi:hypothetical protein [Actinacidiphila sp. bgisy167]|uniref:hypothetical protein n=1 Tax=Actinacidiphila sp. bgisy167 TaxID=3413797 RepID=UPI003D740B61